MAPLLKGGQRASQPAPATPSIPVASLSIWDPIFFGMDEFAQHVSLELVYRNLLLGGEPGAGKSGAINNVIGHAALSPDCQLWLFDGKQVEMGLFRPIAEEFVGKSIDDAIDRQRALQREMDRRYDELDLGRRRKITPDDNKPIIVAGFDEVAYYSTTVGTKAQQDEFVTLLRDLVARGRAAGIPVVATTQRPSVDIIPTSLRDLFGYRCAFRCTTDISSDIILGQGYAKEGFTAKSIAPEDLGVGFLRAEGGIPRRMKTAYLTDAQIYDLVDMAAWIRTKVMGAAA